MTLLSGIFQKSRCKEVLVFLLGFFLRFGIGTNITQRSSFIAAFPFMCLAFHTKHSKHQMPYNQVAPVQHLGSREEERGSPLSLQMAERVPSAGGFVLPHSCNPAPHSGSQSQAGHLTVGGSPPGPLFCPASRGG